MEDVEVGFTYLFYPRCVANKFLLQIAVIQPIGEDLEGDIAPFGDQRGGFGIEERTATQGQLHFGRCRKAPSAGAGHRLPQDQSLITQG